MTTMPRRGILAYACIIAAIALLGAVVYFHATDNHTLLRPLAPTTAALATIALLLFVTCDLEVIAWARRLQGKFIAWKVRRGKPLDPETLINLDRVAYEIAVLRNLDDQLSEDVAREAAFKVLDEYSQKNDACAVAYAVHLLDRYRTHRTNHTRQANHA